MTESVLDATKRASFAANYQVPRTYCLSAQIPQELNPPTSGFFLGSGSVSLSGNVITTPTTYLSAARGGQLTGGINQGYIDPATGMLAIRIVQTSAVFPANCLPLFEATCDGVNLIRSLVDFRPIATFNARTGGTVTGQTVRFHWNTLRGKLLEVRLGENEPANRNSHNSPDSEGNQSSRGTKCAIPLVQPENGLLGRDI